MATKTRANEYIYLNGNGAPVDKEEEAKSVRVKQVGSGGGQWDWHSSEATPDELRMLAILGVKTLASNEGNSVRNDPKTKGMTTPQDELAAITARFALVRSGTWADRTREGVSYDEAKGAEAITNLMVAAGQVSEADRDAFEADILDRIQDKATFAQFRTLDGFAAEYNKLKGKTGMSASALMAKIRA